MATRLETARLVLRTFERRDVDDWIAMFTDPEVLRFLDAGSQAQPRTREMFFAQLAMRHALEAELGFAVLAVELAETGVFVGQCGLRPLSVLSPDAGDEIDLGYHFASAYWGRGYATEAVCATLEHGFGSAGLNEVMALADDGNIGSWRVLEKAGMREAGTASYYGAGDLRKYVARRDSWDPDTRPGPL